MQIDNVIIDYSSEKKRNYRNIKGKSIKICIVNLIRLLETLLDFLAIRRRHRNFNSFTNNRLRLSQKYSSIEELKRNPPDADWYIAGSDQLWNVSTVLRKEFFLDFGGTNVKRASYAVSMGSYEVSDEYRLQINQILKHFDAISVREIQAKNYIESILDTSVSINVNIDPVFLLSKEEWSDFATIKRIQQKYILCYPMSGHPLMQKVIDKLKELTGYTVVIVTTEIFTHIKGDTKIKDATPEEFVYLIENAEFVLTTSFHGIVFSTIFNKKFYSLVGGPAPTRITELLKLLDLENRIIKDLDDINIEEIDYKKANLQLQKEKKSALEYLNFLIQSISLVLFISNSLWI